MKYSFWLRKFLFFHLNLYQFSLSTFTLINFTNINNYVPCVLWYFIVISISHKFFFLSIKISMIYLKNKLDKRLIIVGKKKENFSIHLLHFQFYWLVRRVEIPENFHKIVFKNMENVRANKKKNSLKIWTLHISAHLTGQVVFGILKQQRKENPLTNPLISKFINRHITF